MPDEGLIVAAVLLVPTLLTNLGRAAGDVAAGVATGAANAVHNAWDWATPDVGSTATPYDTAATFAAAAANPLAFGMDLGIGLRNDLGALLFAGTSPMNDPSTAPGDVFSVNGHRYGRI